MSKTHKPKKLTAMILTLAMLIGIFCTFGVTSASALPGPNATSDTSAAPESCEDDSEKLSDTNGSSATPVYPYGVPAYPVYVYPYVVPVYLYPYAVPVYLCATTEPSAAPVSCEDNSEKLSDTNGASADPEYSMEDLKKLSSTDNFDEGVLSHIFSGELNSKGQAVGYHYEGIKGSEGKRSGNILSINSDGVYTSEVNINGHTKQSTFFPKKMEPQDVVNAINQAYQNSQVLYCPQKNVEYREGSYSNSEMGIASMKIGMYVKKTWDDDNQADVYKIQTAYPLL